jgi:hypothetical protein
MGSIIAGLGIAAGTALASIWNASEERDARERMANQLQKQGEITADEYRQIMGVIEKYYDERQSMGTKQDVDNYLRDIRDWNPSKYDYDWKKDKGYESFDNYFGNKTKEDYLNPYYDAIIGDTADQIQHSAAGAGLGRGTGAALNIAKGVAQKSDELYKTALQEYNTDRSQKYQEYSDYITNMQNRYKNLQQNDQFKLQLEGQLANDYYNVMDQKQADILKARQDAINAQTQYNTAMAGLG